MGVCLLPQRLRLNLLADSLDHGHRLVANIKQASFLWLAIKGQLISKCPYEKSVLSKIPTKNFPRFLT